MKEYCRFEICWTTPCSWLYASSMKKELSSIASENSSLGGRVSWEYKVGRVQLVAITMMGNNLITYRRTVAPESRLCLGAISQGH